jgi:phage repressor protein C with HTH and peptisase S24 domain
VAAFTVAGLSRDDRHGRSAAVRQSAGRLHESEAFDSCPARVPTRPRLDDLAIRKVSASKMQFAHALPMHLAQIICATMLVMEAESEAIGQRLKQARIARGFLSAARAARRFHWNVTSYQQAENGTRPPSRRRAAEYAKKFRISLEWLLTGAGKRDDTSRNVVPLVGYVGAGAALNYFDVGQGPFDEVIAPPEAAPKTVAVEVRGDSMRQMAQDGWLLYYEERRQPVTDDLIGKLCVVGLSNGKVLVKTLQKGSKPRRFHLLSSNADPMFDQSVAWAAEVIWIKPR